MLKVEEEALVALAAAVATGDTEAVERAAEVVKEVATPVAAEEVLLQSHLFVGFPRAMEAMAVWRSLAGEGSAWRVAERDDEVGSWAERGEHVCARVYGGQYDRLRQNIARLHPDLERWMLVDGYGKVLGRPGLTLRVREFCIVAQLAVVGAPRQLYSHMRGALNAGATEGELQAVLAVVAGVSGERLATDARGVLERVRSRAGSRES